MDRWLHHQAHTPIKPSIAVEVQFPERPGTRDDIVAIVEADEQAVRPAMGKMRRQVDRERQIPALMPRDEAAVEADLSDIHRRLKPQQDGLGAPGARRVEALFVESDALPLVVDHARLDARGVGKRHHVPSRVGRRGGGYRPIVDSDEAPAAVERHVAGRHLAGREQRDCPGEQQAGEGRGPSRHYDTLAQNNTLRLRPDDSSGEKD